MATPKKSAVFLLAAQLAEEGNIISFYEAIYCALKEYGIGTIQQYCQDCVYGYTYFSLSEKVMCLLLLSAMYESQGE